MKIPNVTIQQLLEAGVHLGHKTLRWNPKMKKYIFGKRDSIHIIDLTQTLELIKIALEKSVELGVDELTPVRFDKSVKSSINHDKLLSSIHSACKQSSRAYFPRLNKLKNFTEWYDDQSVNIVCLINSDKTIIEQLDTIKNLSKNKKINLIVGPEGDFSENEKKMINEKNFIKVNLGRTILRTETAIVSLISIINELLINNE